MEFFAENIPPGELVVEYIGTIRDDFFQGEVFFECEIAVHGDKSGES